MVYIFYKNHICVFLSVLKKSNTLHLYGMSGGIKTLKHNVRTTLQLAYHGCKNLTHTSKTAHVQAVVGLRLGGPEARLKRGLSDDVIILSQP